MTAPGQPGNTPWDEEDRATKATTVGDAWGTAGARPCVVPNTADLHQMAQAAMESPAVRTIAVVDREGRLAGIIPLALLLDELFHRVAPEEFLAEILEAGAIEEYGRISRAATAGELMQPPASVTVEDTVRTAFGLLHDLELEGLPIVDAGGRPVGYLDRLHLLWVWLRTHPVPEGDRPQEGT